MGGSDTGPPPSDSGSKSSQQDRQRDQCRDCGNRAGDLDRRPCFVRAATDRVLPSAVRGLALLLPVHQHCFRQNFRSLRITPLELKHG